MKRICVVLAQLVALFAIGSAQQRKQIFIGPNVMVSSERPQDGPQYELHIAAHPSDPLKLLSTGILQRRMHPELDQEPRAYLSSNGGATWRTIRFPEVSALHFGDPQVGFGKTGTAYFLALHESSESYFYRSEDEGVTWNKPVIFPFIDHPMLVTDHTDGKFSGNVYFAGLYKLHPNLKFGDATDAHIGVYRSSDDGKSWTLVDVANNHNLPNRRVQSAEFPVVLADGELFVPFTSFGNYRDAYWYVSSKDGGTTFTSPQKLVIEGGGEIFGLSDPVFSVDNSDGPFRDRLYVAWSEDDGQPGMIDPSRNRMPGKLMLSYSSNRGKSWSKPISVSASSKGSQFRPTLAVNKNGVLGMAWYDTRDSIIPNKHNVVNQYFTASLDGGQSFLPAVRVSSESTDLDQLKKNVTGVMIFNPGFIFLDGTIAYRDYFGMAASVDNIFHPIWLDGRTGSQQIWTASIKVGSSDQRESTTRGDLVEADVSDKVELLFDPPYQFAPAGEIDLPIRIRNKSQNTIVGPLRVEITSLTGRFRNPATNRIFDLEAAIFNTDNGKQGIGGIMDYSRALGDFKVLRPGEVSEGVVWRIRAPTKPEEFPQIGFKVTGWIERPKEATPAKSAAPKP